MPPPSQSQGQVPITEQGSLLTPVLIALSCVLVAWVGPMGTLTLVLDVRLVGRGALRDAVSARSVWSTLTVREAPELTCTCLLHERKRDLLVVVKVVQEVVIRIAKDSVGRGMESGHEDRLQDINKVSSRGSPELGEFHLLCQSEC